MFTLIITLNGCYSDDPLPLDDTATEVTSSSFSESEETTETELPIEVDTEEVEEITQEETEDSKDIAEADTTTVSVTTETPKSNDTEKNNKSDTANNSTEQTKSEETTSSNQTQPATLQPTEEPTETYVKATKDDCKAIAQKILEYINSYRSTSATKLPGLTEYAEYRSRQLVSNFAHDTDDERAAATALGYGEYIDTALYGMDGEPYYEVNAREAIACAGYAGSVDIVAEKMALLVKNSSGHWAYVGSSDYPYIAVGVTYESGMWYCDIAVARENTDNN